MSLNRQSTAREIAQHYAAAMDSVNLINSLVAKNSRSHEERDTITRNVEHLEIILKREPWTTQDLNPFKKAIASGRLTVKRDNSISPLPQQPKPPALEEWTGNIAFKLEEASRIADITKQWFGANNFSTIRKQIMDINSNPQLLDIKTKAWNRKVKVNKVVQASSSGDTITADAPEKFVPAIGSVLTGGKSRDIVQGKTGWDIIDGGDGSDFIHGGNGRDVITGGSGGDELWGDFGLNTFKSEKDGQKDLVVIKSDHYVYNWYNDSYTNNPNGERTDFIEGLETWDRIRVTGGYKQDLRFAENVTHMGQTGIAIYLKDSLEALYTGNDLSLDQIKNMTDGDGSDAAIANSVHQYGLDWL